MKRTAKQRRQEAAIRIRMLKGCNRCGWKPESRDYVKALQFHHVDPSTKVNEISNLYGARDEVFYPEVRKTIILCARCHIMTHIDEENLGKRRIQC